MSEGLPAQAYDAVRIVRVIARLNIGGPAIQAITLTARMQELGYSTVLVRGVEEPDEGSMDDLAQRLGVHGVLVPWLRRNPGLHDIRALAALVRIIRRERPHIVHTHAAKAGTLGRVAALLAFPLSRRRRPILIHTYHGHSLTGYFSARVAAVYRSIEQVLARATDRLVAVSTEVRDELVAMNVAPVAKFDVVPLGLDLSRFTVDATRRNELRGAVRRELGIPSQARVVTLVARLVPIKRVDRFLRLAQSLADAPEVRFIVVGDGELRESLHDCAEALALRDRIVWTGFRADMPSIYFASDVVVQTSDNEGTPVALIEAQAAGVPVVSTRVGGSESVVGRDRLVEPDDEQELSRLVRELLTDSRRATEVGAGAGVVVRQRFAFDRLLADIDDLYRRMLSPSG